jgi:hypothetical protein
VNALHNITLFFGASWAFAGRGEKDFGAYISRSSAFSRETHKRIAYIRICVLYEERVGCVCVCPGQRAGGRLLAE